MRKFYRWPLMAPLILALAACTLGPTPTPEPPTPTPRARAEQIAQATEISARITATAVARAVPTASVSGAPPTPITAQGSGPSGKLTIGQLQSGPLPDGFRFEHPSGRFALTAPADWTPYPIESVLIGSPPPGDWAAIALSPLPPRESPLGLSVIIYDLPESVAKLSLGDVTNALVAQRREAGGPAYELVGRDRVGLNGLPIDRHTYRTVIAGERSQKMEAFLIVGDKLHSITFSDSPETFADRAILFDAILASYTIGTPSP